MADNDLLRVYDRLGSLDVKLEALIARVDVQLVHGAKKMDDMEGRLRVLEQWRWKVAGGSALAGMAGGSALAGMAGGSAMSALITWALSR